MTKCNTCNKKISEKTKVCPNCGERTVYGVKKQRSAIIVLIILLILIFLFLIFGKTVIKAVKVVGVWKYTEEYNTPVTDEYLAYHKATKIGKKTITYTFKSNGECKRQIQNKGVETYEKKSPTVRDLPNKLINTDYTDKCIYEHKNKKIELYFPDTEETEKYYIRVEKNNLYIDGDKYIKMD